MSKKSLARLNDEFAGHIGMVQARNIDRPMIKKIIFFIIILSLLIAGLIFFSGQPGRNSQVAENSLKNIPAAVHQAEPADREFYDTVYGFVKTDFDFQDKAAVAGIAPHHLLAGDLIAEFYRQLLDHPAETVILLGPNHFNAGQGVIITSDHAWQTPFGKMECDRDLLASLRSNISGITLEPAVMDGEHAVKSHAGFIKKTFPAARFLPLVLRPGLGTSTAAALAEALALNAKEEKIIVIASVDFSHYQDSETAVSHDRESIIALQTGDFESVYGLDIDSPPSLYVLMKYAELNGARFVLSRNANSALLSKKLDLESTTSYVAGYYIRD